MTLDIAQQEMERYSHLIGQKVKDRDRIITNVIIAPVKDYERFLNEVVKNPDNMSTLFNQFNSQEYTFVIVYKLGDGKTIQFDDQKGYDEILKTMGV